MFIKNAPNYLLPIQQVILHNKKKVCKIKQYKIKKFKKEIELVYFFILKFIF